jgi:hypothetical protein
VRVEITDPNGNQLRFLSVNAMTSNEGTFAGKWRLALNDSKGDWTIIAKDIVSGITAKKTFIVEEWKGK